ncbi:hypothetical protein [Erwinia sp. HR93]|uniref:hypothetical protein n=1 Tax=Erwinia sp. HR93 TaxID=3094840 RepID=UPI002ADEA8DA|nr:hypothetical protein [Erwinia sp. HR93]MEA1064109.1 hypothetical protein [Erwinia sp. HR93]
MEEKRIKKTCASAQVGVTVAIDLADDATYQYLWDINCNSARIACAMKESQQPFAKCN